MKTIGRGLCIGLSMLMSSCGLRFNNEEEVMTYLKERFPGRQVTLLPGCTTNRGWPEDCRIWNFTLSGYPQDTFQVACRIQCYPPIPIKTERFLQNNFEQVIILRRSREFEQGPLLAFDAPTRRIWRHFTRGSFSQKAVTWYLETLDDIERAKQLIDAFETFLEEDKVSHQARYCLCMYMQGPCYDLEGEGKAENIMDHLWNSKPGGKSPHYLEYAIYDRVDRQLVCRLFRNGVMRYHQLMADRGNGVTDDNLQAWVEEQQRLSARWPEMTKAERDSLRELVVCKDDDIHNVFLDTGQKPFLMAFQADSDYRPDSRGIFLTYPQLRELCLRCGLQVQGRGDQFTVRGVDGARYEFAVAFYKKVEQPDGGTENTYFYRRNGRRVPLHTAWGRLWCADDALVRQVTGLDLRPLVR